MTLPKIRFSTHVSDEMIVQDGIDCRRNSILGTPFFLSKSYKSLDRFAVHTEYLGFCIFGRKPPLIASLRVSEKFNIDGYIYKAKGGQQLYWQDPLQDEFLAALDSFLDRVSKEPIVFIISDPIDEPVCEAYMAHHRVRSQIALERDQGLNVLEARVLEKYQEKIDEPSVSSTRKRKR